MEIFFPPHLFQNTMYKQKFFGEKGFFGFSLLFNLMDGYKFDHGFCDYFYSAVFVKKTVTADKNLELWSVPNTVRIQRSYMDLTRR